MLLFMVVYRGSGLLFCYWMKYELFGGMEIFGYNNMNLGIRKTDKIVF